MLEDAWLKGDCANGEQSEGNVVLAATKYAINWVLCDAEPLSQHMAASVGCKVWAHQRVPAANQNDSRDLL